MKEILMKLSKVAELERKICQLKNQKLANDRIASRLELLSTIREWSDEVQRIKAELRSMMYNPDSEITKALEYCKQTKGSVTAEDILTETKLNDEDAVYAVKVKTILKNGKQYTQIFHIYMDSDYTGRETIYKQDVINTVWGICEFFGQALTDILEVNKT